MTRTHQEISARKINAQTTAPRFQDARFDCELPFTARAELRVPPRRPRILRHPNPLESQPRARYWLLLSAIILVLGLVASLSTSLRHQEPQRPAIARLAPVPLPSPLAQASAPTPRLSAKPEPSLSLSPRQEIQAPVPQRTPDSNWQSTLLSSAPPPRAELIKLPPPRAQLVRLPNPAPRAVRILHEGDSVPLSLPCGIRLLTTIRGYKESFQELPSSASIGDLWIVGQERTPWVFVVTPGTNFPQWVDP